MMRPPRKPTTSQRGYGWRRQVARARVKRVVDTGAARCTRCGAPISPFERWDLDHLDHPDAKRLGLYRGPSHTGCNRGWRRRSPAARSNPEPAAALQFFNTKAR
jgi:hypothetical protein